MFPGAQGVQLKKLKEEIQIWCMFSTDVQVDPLWWLFPLRREWVTAVFGMQLFAPFDAETFKWYNKFE